MIFLYKSLFMSTLILGTFTAISANSWIGMWMGLEINLLSIIPLMNNSKNLMSSEASLKYFITQALASMFILLAALISTFKTMGSNLIICDLPNLIIMSSLLTKMGAAPFHFWFPQVLEGLSWMNSFIMLTWQKIAPMIIMFYLPFSQLIMLVMVTCLITSALMGLNQTSMRKILVYSSINHIAWMLSSLMFNEMIWLVYFSIYSIMNLMIIIILKKINLFQISQLGLNSLSPKMKMMFMLNFFSLGGIPPFIGFLPKWWVIQLMAEEKLYLLSLTMIILTLFTLFYYMRIALPSFNLVSASNMKTTWNKPMMKNPLITSFTVLSSLPYLALTLNWI
uniref:NADH dehydrogenase subunit 2 n=1 Tax=Sambus kanssuensis TaxID=3045898 RepID=UPI00257DDEC7|nr:NADH dehydrogenase subunit 2 [Sambus kanssuensis]WHE42534.1 NADH dehydrogenase subunit 2 [Sambus kanssuensis]